MGLQDREYYRDDRPGGLTLRPPETMVVTLMLINVAIYIVDAIFLPDHWLSRSLAMEVQTLWNPLQWWKMLTAGFAHSPYGIWHIVGNMFVLFFFGRDIEGIYGKRAFLSFYLSTVVISSVSWALFGYFFLHANPASYAFGASGAVSGVLMLYILHFPRRTLLLFLVVPVPAWLLGVFWVLYDFFGIKEKDGVAHSAHLAGFACGYLFYKSGWSLNRALPGKFSWPSFKRRPKLRVHNPKPRENVLESEADRVLAKLHAEGADSLSPREQKILEDYSRRMKQKHR